MNGDALRVPLLVFVLCVLLVAKVTTFPLALIADLHDMIADAIDDVLDWAVQEAGL